jgi:uncharacterized protein
MKLKFLNRENEQRRLKNCLQSHDNFLVVLYGRRRCGKSTLLQFVANDDSIYYLATQSSSSLQLAYLATEIARHIPGFDSVNYPDWHSLLMNLNDRSTKKYHLIIDEFPYLVNQSPELPSIIQKYLDSPGSKNINFILCGSSQRMMHNIILDAKAPLYGRAREIFQLTPLKPGWIMDALNINAQSAVEYYAVFGGIPRYWELAAEYSTLTEAIKELILDKKGVLHDEPMRLLLDDLQSAIQPYSILTLLGAGCRKVSEIASRLEIPVSSMSRPLATLQNLGYVKKELPFGVTPRKSKKSLYSLNDNFLNFYFRFVVNNRSMLEMDLIDKVWNSISARVKLYNSTVWEELARQSVPLLNIENIEWGMAQRWWGKSVDGQEVEIDILAESLDKKYILAGEVKWADNIKPNELINKLKYSVSVVPKLQNRKIIYALWCKNSSEIEIPVITPEQVFNALR